MNMEVSTSPPGRARNFPLLVATLVFALVFLAGLILFFVSQGKSDKIVPNTLYRQIQRQLRGNLNQPENFQKVRRNIRHQFSQESGLEYLLVKPDLGEEILALFKKTDPPVAPQVLRAIKKDFHQLGGTPRGYFRAYGFDHYFSRVLADNGDYYWVQFGSARLVGAGKSVQNIALGIMIVSVFAVLILASLQFVRRQKRRLEGGGKPPFFSRGGPAPPPDPRGLGEPVIHTEVNTPAEETAKEPEKEPAVTSENGFASEEAGAPTTGTAAPATVPSGDQPVKNPEAEAPPMPKKLPIAVGYQHRNPAKLRVVESTNVPEPGEEPPKPTSGEEETSRGGQRPEPGFTLEDPPVDSTTSQDELLFWEHRQNLLEFWKKFLNRVSVYCHQEDYLFLFVKRQDFENSSATSLQELEEVIGRRGNIFLSAGYMRDNQVRKKLFLEPLLRVKGTISKNRNLLQLPLATGNHLFGALLIYRPGKPILEGQIRQVWREISGLSDGLLKVRQYDMALRDRDSGLFNQRHFQFSLGQTFKLRDSQPSRSLSIFWFRPPKDNRELSLEEWQAWCDHLCRQFSRGTARDEELFLLHRSEERLELAILGEARASLEEQVAGWGRALTAGGLEEDWQRGFRLFAGNCLLTPEISSPRRWLENCLIVLQEAEYKGHARAVRMNNLSRHEEVKIPLGGAPAPEKHGSPAG